MGRLFVFTMIIVFIDLMFLATGQVCLTTGGGETCSLSSIIFQTIIDITEGTDSNFFRQLIGNIGSFLSGASVAAGLLSLVVGGAVTLAGLYSKSDMLLRIGTIAPVLAVLGSDFIVIFLILADVNILLATFIIAPLLVGYGITVLDWINAKD